MIRYTLACERKHEFEIWFNSSADYDRQIRRGLVGCPVCNSTKVDKAVMAPAIRSSARRRAEPLEIAEKPSAPAETGPVAMLSPQETEFRAKLRELHEHLTKNAVNVGKDFPDEARKIHYGEAEQRSIYGEASPEEAKKLREEGIEFQPLPPLPDEKN